jgi:hypothetical protein
MTRNRDTYISPLIEARMVDASLVEKRAAQDKLWAFFDAMYRVYLRLESEGRFPLTDDNFR